MIGISTKTTRVADKLRLGFAIRLGGKTTMRASLRGMFGIGKEHRDSSELCLVSDEPRKLAETPPVVLCILALSYSGSLSYAFEFFQYYCSANACGFVNNTPTDNMVNRAFEPSLPARNTLEVSLGRASAFGLKLSPQPFVAKSVSFDFFAAKLFAIRSSGKAVDAKVNADAS